MILPNLRHLRAFVAVVDTGSFIAAAEEVHIGQPALSQAVAKLEQQVGVRLIERTSRSVRLTPAGVEFLAEARRVLAAVEQMMARGSDWAGARRGKLELLALPSVAHRLLPALVLEFQRLHPEIEVSLHDHRDPVLRQRLLRGEGDLAIIAHSGDALPGPALPFLLDRMRVLVPAGHPLALQSSVQAAQLADQRMILMRRGAVFRSYADAALNAVVFEQAPVEVDQASTMIGMVEAGMGIAVLPALSCPTNSLTSVVSLPLLKPHVHRTLAFVRPAAREPMPAVLKFAQLALSLLGTAAVQLPVGCDLLHVAERRMRKFFSPTCQHSAS